uniref:Uncharacterized protein n=1 Tax=Aegilops tauschii subsp. strangulata TaxID=200361 RepID=A0A453GRD9_AEGTS
SEKTFFSRGPGNEERRLQLLKSGLLQTEWLSPLNHLQGIGLILQFVIDQIHPLLGMLTEDQYLQSEDVLSFTAYKAYVANAVGLWQLTTS